MLTVQYPENQIRNLLDLRGIPLHSGRLKAADAADAVTRITPLRSPTEIDHYQIQRVIDIYVNPAGRTWPARRRNPPRPGGDDAASRHPRRDARHGTGDAGVVSELRVRADSRARAALPDSRRPIQVGARSAPDSAGGAAGRDRRAAGALPDRTTLNVQSLMGVVMMVGMVVSNSILIVEFTHRLEDGGMPLLDAV